ncbi:MAG: GNAT family N-acetyltransferase, partial [Vicinamibacterales bacterium]
SSLTPVEFRMYLVEEEENFDPTLWFLAIDDSTGEIAGYTLNRLERPGEPQTAHTRYVAVRRPYRRRGIGQALLLHTFREFFKRGKRRAGLAVDSTSLTGADRLYERAGMHASHQSIIFMKVMREGDGQ